jgi:hypothetical protein
MEYKEIEYMSIIYIYILSDDALSYNISQRLTLRWNWQNPRVTVELASFHFSPFQTKGAESPTIRPCHTVICQDHMPAWTARTPFSFPYHLIPKHTQLSLHFCKIRCLMPNCSGYMLDEADCDFSVYSPLMQLDGVWPYISLLVELHLQPWKWSSTFLRNTAHRLHGVISQKIVVHF